MPFTTMDELNLAIPGQERDFAKSLSSTQGTFMSYWAATGTPAAGATPSSGLAGNVPTKDTLGAIPFNNPDSGSIYLARAGLASNGPGALLIYDRLWHNSGISATLTSAQTINSVALTRPDALGENVEAWLQVYAIMGSGTPTVTLTYTDQDGNTGQSGSSGVLTTGMTAGRTVPFSLAAGDTGVRSIQTWQSSATFTSGTIGLVLRRLIAIIPFFHIQDPALYDAIRLGLGKIENNACLEFLWFSELTNTIILNGTLSMAKG